MQLDILSPRDNSVQTSILLPAIKAVVFLGPLTLPAEYKQCSTEVGCEHSAI